MISLKHTGIGYKMGKNQYIGLNLPLFHGQKLCIFSAQQDKIPTSRKINQRLIIAPCLACFDAGRVIAARDISRKLIVSAWLHDRVEVPQNPVTKKQQLVSAAGIFRAAARITGALSKAASQQPERIIFSLTELV